MLKLLNMNKHKHNINIIKIKKIIIYNFIELVLFEEFVFKLLLGETNIFDDKSLEEFIYILLIQKIN